MYKLENLPFNYQDLEPFIDTHTIGLHYKKHQQNYLNNLNNLLNKNNYDYRYNLNELIYHINEFDIKDQENILFNLGGVLNHNLYWLSINKNSPVTGKLKNKIETQYNNFENFWNKFKEKTLELKGSGYTFLVIKSNNELDIINLKNQDLPILYGYIPLFTIDLWEHAYYLNYQNDKAKYIDNIKLIANFSYANNLYNNISK